MMSKLYLKYPVLQWIWQGIIIVLASTMFGVAMKMFQIPGNIYAGGVGGIAQLITFYLNNYTPFQNVISTGTLFFLLNVPLIILSYFVLGRKFTFLTLIVVFASSMATNLVPLYKVSDEPLLNAICSGVLAGSAIGLVMKYGMSSGGTDIITMSIARYTGANVGSLSLAFNCIIIAFAIFFYSMEMALFTLISMFVSSRMINVFHTNEQRLTVFVVTKDTQAVTESIYRKVRRGITILEGHGGYSMQKRLVLMVVINRYELFDLRQAVYSEDSTAFINVVRSVSVHGNFLSRLQQEKLLKN